jgi:hypothetical protein
LGSAALAGVFGVRSAGAAAWVLAALPALAVAAAAESAARTASLRSTGLLPGTGVGVALVGVLRLRVARSSVVLLLTD